MVLAGNIRSIYLQRICQPLWAAPSLLEGHSHGMRALLLVTDSLGLFWEPDIREILAMPGDRSKNVDSGAGRTWFEFCLCCVTLGIYLNHSELL